MESERRPDPADKSQRHRSKRRRPRGQARQAPDGTPVVRLDIYASSEGAGAHETEPALESRGHVAELERLQHELEARTAELDRRERELADRERALAEREDRVERARVAEVDAADVERRKRRLATQEEALSERTHELRRLEQQVEEREERLAEREAHVRVELDFKEDELETRERAVTEHEQRLARKESELNAYVGQLQGRLTVVK